MTLRIVGGTEAGDTEAPPVWEDEHEGVARILRSVAEWEPSFVSIVCGKADGSITVFSNFDNAEGAIGFLHRGMSHLHDWCKDVAAKRKEDGPDGA